ncbi:hypothetical protein ACEF96_004406 [Salmonella enterica]|nr:hypothetical protein [Salmonella enterica]
MQTASSTSKKNGITSDKLLGWYEEIDDVVKSLSFIIRAMDETSQEVAILSIVAAQLSQVNDNIDQHGRGLK